jgi:hypothetical protein
MTATGAIAPDFHSWSKSVPPAMYAAPGLDAWIRASCAFSARLY